MHMAHLSGNTSAVSKSSSDWLNYTGFPGDVCSWTFRLEKRCSGAKPSHERRKPCVYKCDMNAYQGQLKAGFSKVCEIFKVRGIESLKYIREFHAPKRDAKWNETNCDWLFVMSVKRPHGRALANESCHLFQTFSHQSEGLATRD